MSVISKHDLSASQQKYFNLAARIARNSPLKKKTGCVIVGSGTVLSTGFNRYCGSFIDPIGIKHKVCSMHAEVAAVLGLLRSQQRSAKVAEET